MSKEAKFIKENYPHFVGWSIKSMESKYVQLTDILESYEKHLLNPKPIELKINQYCNHIEYLDDVIVKTQLLQLVKEDKEEWRFRVNSEDNCHFTVSKNFKNPFDHTWYSGINKTLKRRSVIEPF